MIRRLAAAAATGLLAGALALAGAAAAHHNAPDVDHTVVNDCGLTNFWTSWPGDDHQVAGAALAVMVDGEVTTAGIGEDLAVGPFDQATVTIRYRVWGGGERDYDSPPLADLDALVDYLDADDAHSPLDAAAPGIAWHEVAVDGCPPSPSPTVSPSPSASTSPEATPSGAASPTGAAGAGGSNALPRTSGLTALQLLPAIGGGLLLTGIAAVALARRRSAPTPSD